MVVILNLVVIKGSDFHLSEGCRVDVVAMGRLPVQAHPEGVVAIVTVEVGGVAVGVPPGAVVELGTAVFGKVVVPVVGTELITVISLHGIPGSA